MRSGYETHETGNSYDIFIRINSSILLIEFSPPIYRHAKAAKTLLSVEEIPHVSVVEKK